MDIFYSLFNRLLPLSFLILAGVIAGRVAKVQRESIAHLLIYIIAPIVVFTSVSQAQFVAHYAFVPFFFCAICSVIAFSFLKIGHWIWRDQPIKNLAAFAAGDANTGYFGLPVAIALFGPEIAGVMVLFFIGFVFYENTVGFYILARGKFSARDALIRLAKLPTLYAFFAALIANHLGLKIEGVYSDLTQSFRGAYSILGMMMIGMGVSHFNRLEWDFRFLSLLFLAKFMVWPALIILTVFLDQTYLHLLDQQAHQIILLLSVCPLAANTVAFSTLLKVEPEKAGLAVILSTLLALVIIPVFVMNFIQ